MNIGVAQGSVFFRLGVYVEYAANEGGAANGMTVAVVLMGVCAMNPPQNSGPQCSSCQLKSLPFLSHDSRKW